VPKITGMLGRRILLTRLRDDRGATLVELLTVTALLGVVLGAVIALYISGARSQTTMTSRFNAQTMLRVGLDKFRKDAHVACGWTAQTGSSVTLLHLSSAVPPTCDQTPVTWCTRGSGGQYGLYRQTGAPCTAGDRLADYLTSGSIFGYIGPDNPSKSWALARIHLDITVNATPAKANLAFHVVDDVALANSPRCAGAGDCPAS
jgi:Prokaryotic N-terminal methylation motif